MSTQLDATHLPVNFTIEQIIECRVDFIRSRGGVKPTTMLLTAQQFDYLWLRSIRNLRNARQQKKPPAYLGMAVHIKPELKIVNK